MFKYYTPLYDMAADPAKYLMGLVVNMYGEDAWREWAPALNGIAKWLEIREYYVRRVDLRPDYLHAEVESDDGLLVVDIWREGDRAEVQMSVMVDDVSHSYDSMADAAWQRCRERGEETEECAEREYKEMMRQFVEENTRERKYDIVVGPLKAKAEYRRYVDKREDFAVAVDSYSAEFTTRFDKLDLAIPTVAELMWIARSLDSV